MTHRKNIAMMDGSMTVGEAVRLILKKRKNFRSPVYGEDLMA